jgi:SAM-dependent methyltransferase
MPKFIGWVPTSPEFIGSFFELCPLSSSDIVYDLGSGDGRLLFAAVERGTKRCVGIDIDPDQVNASRQAAKSKGMDNRVIFIEADVMAVDLSDATVIFCYLFPSASEALGPKFEKELKPGTRVVMESFPVPGWTPDKVGETNGRRFYFYTMPAGKTEDYESIINTLTNERYDYF